MDMVGNRALSDCKRVLNAGGRYVPCSGGGGDWLGPSCASVAIVTEHTIGGDPLTRILDGICSQRGKPLVIRSDTTPMLKRTPTIS
jgi:hypothetical protein